MRAPVCILVLLLPLATGCANHVRFVELQEERELISVAEVRYGVEAESEVVAMPRLHVDFSVEELLETRTEKTVTRVEEVTPYNPLREFYEVPLGAVSLLPALTASCADVLLFGAVPNALSRSYPKWSLAAVNPVLNTQSPSRVEQREVESTTQRGEATRTVLRRPLAYQTVEVGFDGARTLEVRTDGEGRVSIHVLDVVAGPLDAPPRKISLRLVDADRSPDVARGEPAKTLDLDVDLSGRIWRAGPWLRVLEKRDASAAELARALSALDRLGFSRFSVRTEEES